MFSHQKAMDSERASAVKPWLSPRKGKGLIYRRALMQNHCLHQKAKDSEGAPSLKPWLAPRMNWWIYHEFAMGMLWIFGGVFV